MCKVKKIDYIKYKYPVKDEISEEIITWKEISGEEFEKLPKIKQQQIKLMGQEIFDEKGYKKAVENCEKYSDKFTENVVKEVVEMITNIYREVSVDSTGYYVDKEFIKTIDEYNKKEIEKAIGDKIENYIGKIIFVTREHPAGITEIIDIDKNNPLKTLRNIIKEFK